MAYITSHKNQNWLLPVSIKSMIPENHICFFVEEFVEDLDFSEFDLKFEGAGAPAYHPRVLMKILLQGMLSKERSSRKIACACRENFVFMYLAEKLIRNMKEGTELRPINHITKEAIIGYLVIVFLTNCLIQLTHFSNKDNVDKNLNLLRKKVNSLTLTIIYDQSVFKFSVLSNITDEIRGILGDSLKEFSEKPPDWIKN